MDTMKPRALKAEARQRLDASPVNPRHLILINTGVVVVLALIVNSLNFLLNHQLSATGGLGGLGMRSVIQTAQTLMSYLVTLFGPFWAAGLLLCFVRVVRREEFGPKTMLEGFRRFSRVLGFALLQMLSLSLLIMPVAYLASFIYAFTPFAASLMESIQGLIDSGAVLTASGALDLTAIPGDVLLKGVVPLSIIMLVVATPVFLWLGYSLHMGPYLIMTDSVRSCFQAFGRSMTLMRGHKLQLLKLDLSYWWFYLLEGAIMGILYFDMISEMLQLSLPVSSTALYFIVLVLYSVCELGLHLWKKAEHDAAFVLAYEQIAEIESLPVSGFEISR